MTPRTTLEQFPDEVLCEIFKRSLWHHRRYTVHGGVTRVEFDKNQAPMVFTYVSQQWRRASLACPKLWSSGLPEIPGMGQSLVRLNELPLTGTAVALSVHFPDDPLKEYYSGGCLTKILGASASLGPSINRLTLDSVPLAVLQSLPGGLLPCLSELMLSFPQPHVVVPESSEGIDSVTQRPVVAFAGITSLVNVVFPRTILNLAGTGGLLIDWSNITTIEELDEESTDDLSPFLERCLPLCMKLDTLRLCMRRCDTSNQSSSPHTIQRTSLPSVTTLALDMLYATGESDEEEMLIPDVLYQFAFPGIDTLILNAEGLQAPSGSRFRKVLEEAFHGAELARLRLNMSYSSREVCKRDCPSGIECPIDKKADEVSKKACEKLGRMLRAFPDVVLLDLLMPVVHDGIFEILTGDLYGGSPRHPARIREILPALEYLRLLGWEDESLDHASTRAIGSRKFADFVLEWLDASPGEDPDEYEGARRITVAECAPDEVKAALRRFSSYGLEVEEIPL